MASHDNEERYWSLESGGIAFASDTLESSVRQTNQTASGCSLSALCGMDSYLFLSCGIGLYGGGDGGKRTILQTVGFLSSYTYSLFILFCLL